MIRALTPTWFREVQDVFYYCRLTGGWLIVMFTIWILWQCVQVHRHPVAAPAPATNVFTTVPMPTPRYHEPSFLIVSETSFSSAPHVNTQPLHEAGVEGGCNAVGLSDKPQVPCCLPALKRSPDNRQKKSKIRWKHK